MLTLSTFIQHSIGSPRKINEARKINLKTIQVRKEEIKLSSFAGNMVLYIKSLKNPQKQNKTKQNKPVRTKKKCNKVAEYKINMKKICCISMHK